MRWPTVMHPAVIQTYDAPSSGMPSGFALQFTPVGLWNRKRLRVYTIVVFSFIRTFAPSF